MSFPFAASRCKDVVFGFKPRVILCSKILTESPVSMISK